jgi:hypothetical protein
MIVIVLEGLLSIAEYLRFVYTKITTRYHRDIIWIRVVVQVGKVAEDRPLPGKAFQKIVLNGRVEVLIFQHNQKDVVKMLWCYPIPRNHRRFLSEAENRQRGKEKYGMRDGASEI